MENLGLFVSPDCSNGGSAESGWTVYLQQSSVPSANYNVSCDDVHETNYGSREDQEELDLSMVSDASSGPQTFRENEVGFPENDHNGSFYPSSETARLARNSRKKKGSEGKLRHEDQEHQSFLDDTATSSPIFNCNTEKPSCSNKAKALRQSPLSGDQKQKNQWLKGKRFGQR